MRSDIGPAHPLYTDDGQVKCDCGADFPSQCLCREFALPQTDQVTVADNIADPQVHHPSHYTCVVPGIEAISVTEHFNFNRGNAIKYIWRAGAKGNEIQDLEKAAWYITREIERLKSLAIK